LIEPYSKAYVNEKGDLQIDINDQHRSHEKISKNLDTTQLSIFSHRFMSIAEQMGR
jgi:5-oxoprolinase (ATP-hydrolysing)